MQTVMKIERVAFACILLIAGAFVAMSALADKQIFKTVDADGNVVFTDVPPGNQQQAETVDLVAPNFYEANAAQDSPEDRELWIVDPDAEDEDEAELARYLSLTISSPENDANVRENTGNLSVHAELNPPLHPGHRMRLLLDNVPAASAGRDATFALTNVDRGTHTLQVEVLDSDGAVIFAGDPSVFHLQRYSIINAPN